MLRNKLGFELRYIFYHQKCISNFFFKYCAHFVQVSMCKGMGCIENNIEILWNFLQYVNASYCLRWQWLKFLSLGVYDNTKVFMWCHPHSSSTLSPVTEADPEGYSREKSIFRVRDLHWSHIFLALTHQYIVIWCAIQWDQKKMANILQITFLMQCPVRIFFNVDWSSVFMCCNYGLLYICLQHCIFAPQEEQFTYLYRQGTCLSIQKEIDSSPGTT